jgi:GMP synthase (glutamine-hydrolysing)
MKNVVVLTHAEFEGPGRIAELVVDAGYSLEVRSLHRGDPVPSSLARDQLLVVMGGSMGVSDLDNPEYPYLKREVELLRRCIAEDAPVLGVCLGAQLLAHAAGARVFPMTGANDERLYEVGWAPIRFRSADSAPVLEGLPPEAIVLHWHGDTFDLPEGARLLASSAICRNQGFQLGHRLFGLQFHCETTPLDVENFLREDEAFVVRANGADGVGELRRATAQHIAEFRTVGDELLGKILGQMSETGPSSVAAIDRR